MKIQIVMNPKKDLLPNVHILKEWLCQKPFLEDVEVEVVKRTYAPDKIRDYKKFNREFVEKMIKSQGQQNEKPVQDYPATSSIQCEHGHTVPHVLEDRRLICVPGLVELFKD